MRIDLDAKVKTSDGKDAGTVQRAVLDPDTNDIRGFVVTTGRLLGREVIVPRGELERASPDGDTLRLRLSKDELEAMEEYRPERYGPPPEAWVPPPGVYGYPPYGYVWPATYGSDTQAVEGGARPRELAVDKGASVVDGSGDDVGVVDEVVMDPATGRIRGFVLRVGGTLETLFGGGHTIEVGADQVHSVGGGTVRLSVGKDWLERAGGTPRDREARR